MYLALYCKVLGRYQGILRPRRLFCCYFGSYCCSRNYKGQGAASILLNNCPILSQKRVVYLELSTESDFNIMCDGCYVQISPSIYCLVLDT